MRVAWILLCIIIFAAIVVVAQETDSEPTSDNLCDADGIWNDGRCNQGTAEEQNWHWTCGWYLAQVEGDVFSMDELRANVPDCDSLYPPKIERQTGASSGSCGTVDDSDCDGLLDVWEMARFRYLGQSGTDDPDMDACNNLCEQQLGTMPDNDTDGDGLLNISEAFFGTDPLNPDTDGDIFNDGIDNCPLAFGPPAGNGC